MYELRDRLNEVVSAPNGLDYRSENLNDLKKIAEDLKAQTGNDYCIYKIEQIYTTQLLG